MYTIFIILMVVSLAVAIKGVSAFRRRLHMAAAYLFLAAAVVAELALLIRGWS